MWGLCVSKRLKLNILNIYDLITKFYTQKYKTKNKKKNIFSVDLEVEHRAHEKAKQNADMAITSKCKLSCCLSRIKVLESNHSIYSGSEPYANIFRWISPDQHKMSHLIHRRKYWNENVAVNFICGCSCLVAVFLQFLNVYF